MLRRLGSWVCRRPRTAAAILLAAVVIVVFDIPTRLAIEVAVGRLDDSDTRQSASRVLRWIGPKAVPRLNNTLEDKLKDPEDPTCVEIITILGELRDSRAAPTLIRCLRYKQEHLNAAAREALINLGAAAASDLVAALSGDDGHSSSESIVEILVRIGPDAVPALIAALKSDHLSTFPQSDVEKAFVRIGSPAVPAMTALLGDRTCPNRRLAASPLGATKDPAAVEALLAALQDEDAGVRAAAAYGLGESGDLRAAPALVNRFQTGEEQERVAAAHALGSLQAVQAVPALMRALRGGAKPVLEAASDALIKIGPAAVPPLATQLETADESLARQLVPILLQLGEPGQATVARLGVEGVPLLVAALDDWRHDVQQAAVRQLCALDPDTAPALAAAFRGKNREQTVLFAMILFWHGPKGEAALAQVGPDAIPSLVAVLANETGEDAVADAAPAAIRTLGLIRDPKAVPELVALLNDDERQHKWALTERNRGIEKAQRDRPAPSPLPERREPQTLDERLQQVREDLIGGDRELLEERRKFAEEVERFNNEEPPDPFFDDPLSGPEEKWVMARIAAVRALGNIGVQAGPLVEQLTAVAKAGEFKLRDQEITVAAIDALGKIGPAARSAVPLLQSLARPPAPLPAAPPIRPEDDKPKISIRDALVVKDPSPSEAYQRAGIRHRHATTIAEHARAALHLIDGSSDFEFQRPLNP